MKKIEYSKFEIMMAALNYAEVVLSRCALHDPYLSNQEFILLLGITDSDAQSIRKLNLIPFEWAGRIIVYRIEDVRNYLMKISNLNNNRHHA